MAYIDPFDLSARKPPAENEEKTPSAVVRRVTFGPLLHSSFVKLIVLLAFMFFAAIGGYAAMQWRLSHNNGRVLGLISVQAKYLHIGK